LHLCGVSGVVEHEENEEELCFLLRAELLLVRDGRATDAWEDVLLTLAPSGGCWLLRKLTN